MASVAAWLVCRLSGYTVAAWVAPLAIVSFLGFSLVPSTRPGEGLEYRSYPTTCTVLTSRTVPLSPSCVVTLFGCVGSLKPCCHSAGAVKARGNRANTGGKPCQTGLREGGYRLHGRPARPSPRRGVIIGGARRRRFNVRALDTTSVQALFGWRLGQRAGILSPYPATRGPCSSNRGHLRSGHRSVERRKSHRRLSSRTPGPREVTQTGYAGATRCHGYPPSPARFCFLVNCWHRRW